MVEDSQPQGPRSRGPTVYQRPHVGKHVPRVGQEGQRVGQNAPDDLHHHERCGEAQDDPKTSRLGTAVQGATCKAGPTGMGGVVRERRSVHVRHRSGVPP